MAVAKEDKAFAARLSKQFGVEVDTRDQHEVIADLRKQGVDAVPQVILPLLERQKDNSITPAVVIDGVELMPLGGIANKVTVVCNQNGEYLTYKSDEHGFHNPGGIWQSGPVDVAAVGNSLTLGYCVPSDKNFVALIRERYPATLNLGMSGEGPLHILGILKEYASRLKPKLVLWFYPEGNSFSELRAEKQSRILVRYLEDDFGQGLPARQRDIDRALIDHVAQRGATSAAQPPRPASRASGLRQCIRLSALRQKLGVVYGTSGGRSEHLSALELSELKEELDLFRDIVSEAKARVAAWGGELYFVYLPSWGRLTNNLGIGDRARTQVLTLVDNLDIPLIDVSPAFQAHRDPLSLFPFRGPGHYNEEGHRVVAEVVLNVLTRRHPNDSGGRTSSGLMPEA
ncbi:MAG: SGNH/GDSL hydrolase family protein [Thermodesulfobacteriota bacterium]